MTEPLLKVESLSFAYPGEGALFHDLSFSVGKGKTFTILGPNGAGKTSLLNCLTGLVPPSAGRVTVGGRDILKLSASERAKRVGYVPQLHQGTYGYSVRDFVVMGRAPHIAFLKSPSPEDYAIADGVLERMGLSAFARRPYTQLSGGERQQVLIARVIVQNPDLIVMDEPTNHLDYGNQIKALKMIRSLTAEGYSVLFTTHTPDHALLIGGEVGILNAQGEMLTGPAERIVCEEGLSSLYGVRLYMDYVKKVDRVACVAPSI